MGSKVSIDKHVSNLEDILEMSPAYFSSKLKFENKIPETITQHIKIWRYYEEDKKSKIVKSAPMSLQAIQSSGFTFVSNECYLVLFVYKKGTEENSPFINFPHSMWSVVESNSNLTPRGLEVPVASSESLTNLNKEVLESFLLPRRPMKKEEGKFEYMIFVWNGKTANPLIKSITLSAAFEFDTFINKAKEPLLHVLFSGGVIRNKKLQKGTILQMNSALPKDLNKELDSKFDDLKDNIYLLKFLFPNPEHKHQALLFNERFLKGNDNNGFHDDQFISIGENIEVGNVDDQHQDYQSGEDQQDGSSYNSQDIEPASISDRIHNNTNHNPPKMNLPLPVRQPHEDMESSDIGSRKKVPAIPTLSLKQRGNPIQQQEPVGSFEPASHNSDRKSDSYDNSPNGHSEPDEIEDNIEDVSNGPRINKGFALDFAGKTEEKLPDTYEALLKMKDKHTVPESLQKKLKMDYFSEICSEVIDDFLFVGGEKIARNLQILEEVGITHVVNAAADLCPDFFSDRIQYLHYYLKDAKFEMIEAIFYDVFSFMEEARKVNGKVLVHCAQGVSRSVTLCIAYLIFSQKKSYAQAEEHLKNSRGVANPNIGFIAQLMNFEKRLHHPFNALISPRIFCVGSHQKESPQTLVVRMINENFYDQKAKKKLDPRSVFIIQTENQIYKWIGNEIFEANKDSKCDEHIKLLQNYEHAPQDVITISAENEPSDFWKIWDKKPEKDYQYNKEWDLWFCDLSDKFNEEGPTIKEDVDEEEEEEEEEEIPMNSSTRPKLYTYPSLDPTTSIDGDRLTDQDLVVLCTFKAKKRSAYIWRGGNVTLSEADEQDYLDAVLANEWPGEDPVSINIFKEIPENESDDFINYFDF